MKRILSFVMLFLLLLELAWGIAWCIPSASERRMQALAETFSPDAPTAEICAEVDLALRVRLTAEDVRAFKRLCLQGTPPAEALQTVVSYRRAIGN